MMKFKNVYTSALRLINERIGSCADTDFASRAPSIASAIVSEAEEIDRDYRTAHGLPEASYPAGTEIPLDDPFPLCDRFAPAAAYFMAAMLILDEDDAEYERFYDLWCDAIGSIAASIPAVSAPTREMYPVR